MQLIDTHSHLFTKHFDHDRAQAAVRAQEVGVVKILLPNIDAASIAPLSACASLDKTLFATMMGLHPCDVREEWQNELSVIEKELFSGGHVAVGEIGLDLYWDKTSLSRQTEAFHIQLKWAKELDVPVAIHCREAYKEVISSLEKEQDGKLKGVLHCFTGSLNDANALINLGFHLGIGGVVTYKNSGLDAVLPHIPIDRILVETDSPYLAPNPHRGKRNESAYVKFVAERIAEILGVSTTEIAQLTTDNAKRLFNLEI